MVVPIHDNGMKQTNNQVSRTTNRFFSFFFSV